MSTTSTSKSANSPPPDLGAEREIDLRRWREAVLAKRWYVVAGLVIGIVVGGLYSLSGGSDYQATVIMQPAQPFSPAGSPILNYTSSPLAIDNFVDTATARVYAAKVAHMPESELIGHVSTASVSTGTGPVATRGTVEIEITVSLPQASRAAAAANAFGAYIIHVTESEYVAESLATYAKKDVFYQNRLNAVNDLIAGYDKVLNSKKSLAGLDSFEQLELYAQLNDQVDRQGNLQDELITNQQAQTLAKNIELAQILTRATAEKVTARSRRDSIIFGAVIGLLIGALVALVLGLRGQRPAAAR